MNCDEWKAFLQDYLAGVLSDPARAAIERHLSDCATCFADARAHKMVETHLRGQPELDVPAGLVDRIMAQVPKPQHVFQRELLRIAAVFVAALGLGIAALTYGYDARIGPPTAQVESARRTIESSFRGALSVTELLKR